MGRFLLVCLLLLLSTCSRAQTAGSTTVHTVSPSARLQQVPFEVEWAQPFDLSPRDDLEYGRGRDGGIIWVSCNRFTSALHPSEAGVWLIPSGAQGAVPTKLTLAAVRKLLESTSPPPEYGWDLRRFTTVQSDAEANVIMGVQPTYYRYPGFVAWRMAEQQMELVVSPYSVSKIQADMGLDRLDAGVTLKLSPQGDAWLLVHDKRRADADLRKSLRLYKIKREGDRKWRAYRVNLQSVSSGGLPSPTQHDVANFAPDWSGGVIFFTGSVLWRVDEQGQTMPIADVGPLSTDPDTVTISPPTVLSNGEVWFAVNRLYSTASHTDASRQTHLSALLGDRSRWVRLRLANGKVEVGEIASELLLAALGKEKIMNTALLRLDYKTGGLLAHDRHHKILYAVKLGD